jgi:nicotinate-nucleotide adenylyltransferase
VKIGVFGGTFDPVHRGHIEVAAAAAQTLDLDQIRLIPTAVQPFKLDVPVSEAVHRLAMLAAAVVGRDDFVVDEREVRRGGISYTVPTLESLHADFPQDQLFLLVGADACRSLPEWKDADRIPGMCTVVELTRPGVELAQVGEIQVEVPSVDVSSTGVRDAVRSHVDLGDAVPAAVAAYIEEHALYR